MKEITKQTKLRLEKYKELYNAALLAAEGYRDRLCRNMDQYLGSDEIDGSTERASVVRNITYELIETEINADIPVTKVDTSCYSAEREQNARAIERLSSALRSRLPFEELNDRDERYTYIYGGSVFYIEWDSSQSDNAGEGGVRVHLLSPLDFIPQPSIESVEDMEYCFLHFTTTRGAAFAWFIASTVWGMMPSSAATTRTAISVACAPLALIAVNASCPGVSRKVIS